MPPMIYISEMKDASIPVTLMISDCEEFVRDSIDAFRRSQIVGLYE